MRLRTGEIHVQLSGNLSHPSCPYVVNLADNQADTPTAYAGEVNYGVPVAGRFPIRNDYGNVEGTRRSRFLFTGVYRLPFGRGRAFLNTGGWKNAVLGGWEMTVETGPWLTPSISPGGCQVPLLSNGTCPLLDGQSETNDQSNTNIVNRGAFLRPDQISAISIRVSRGRITSIWRRFRQLQSALAASATLESASSKDQARPRPASV
ncbi:MAG TPA: hypothetical protein VIX14_12830 [Terriglobales bacterium]